MLLSPGGDSLGTDVDEGSSFMSKLWSRVQTWHGLALIIALALAGGAGWKWD